MTKRNKLNKHHKTKAHYYLKDFSFAIFALLGIGAALTVPTYIASRKSEEVTIKADTNENKELTNKENNEEVVEEEKMLSY